MFDITFIMLILSVLTLLAFTIFLFNVKEKKQIHYTFIILSINLFCWTIVSTIENYAYYHGYRGTLLNIIAFIFIFFVPVSLYFAGLVFRNTTIKFAKRYLLLFVIPLISVVTLTTNDYHHLFFKRLTILNSNDIFGPYFYVHVAYSYLLVFLAVFHLLYSSIKASGTFSKQAILIVLGVSVPFVVNMIYTFGILPISCDSTPAYFSFLIIIWGYAIFKYDFFNITPIALEKIMNHISESFIVIDEKYNIVDFNKSFCDNFSGIIDVKKTKNLTNEIDKKEGLNLESNLLIYLINQSKSESKTISVEKEIKLNNFEKVFNIEITPILNYDRNVGTIILFKDITELRKAYAQLIEQERLASLGQLIGGITHDINTPLSAEQANHFTIKERAREILLNGTLTKEEYQEIANEIINATNLAESANNKISKTIESIRSHTRNLSISEVETFSVGNIVELLKALLNHKLKQHNCTISYMQNTEKDVLIKGDPGKLQQVIMNFISNSVESYDENGGTITIAAEDKDSEIIISVKDNGCGIPNYIKEHIFKEILTTKGTKGTGMGMYFSNSIITGEFGGRLTLKSQEGEGTTIDIILPKERKVG